MSETYTKLFSSITRSSIWLEDDQTLRVWVTMLALADRHGYVGASVGGLAAVARVSREKTAEAIQKFLSPDPDSRSQEHDGRRIEETDRGWNILNYQRFRDMRDEELRREYERNRKREQRHAKRSNVPDVSPMSRDVPVCPAMSAQAEAEAEAELKPPMIPPAGGDAKPKRQRKSKSESTAALEAALDELCKPCPPVLGTKLKAGASQRVSALVEQGACKTHAEAAGRLVAAWKALGTGNAWKLLDVDPVAPPRGLAANGNGGLTTKQRIDALREQINDIWMNGGDASLLIASRKELEAQLDRESQRGYFGGGRGR